MRKFCFLIGASLLATPAIAQQADNAAAQPERSNEVADIVVTAQKRAERLIDAPQTINVVSGDQLEQLNITNFQDITKVVPGLTISAGTGREQAISLRGVGFSPDAGTTDTVDVYLNEVPFDSKQAIQAQFDIGSIQVLRGPQGTLRGGTGPSGAILIGTRQPNLTQFEGTVTASATHVGSINTQGGVSIPVIPDKLAVRVAGLYSENDGNNVNNIVNGDRSRDKAYAGRISVMFEPTSDLSFLLMHQEFRDKRTNLLAVASAPDVPVGRFGVIDRDDRVAVSLGTNAFQTKGSATILNGAWDFGENRLSYVGSRQVNEFNTERDLNIANGLTPAFFGPLGNLPFQQYQAIDIKTKQWTHEARFERTGEHFWLYRFGVFFSDTDTFLNGLVDYTGANGACKTAPGPLSFVGLPCNTLGYAKPPHSRTRGYFTTQTFNFTDDDTLDLGLRYTTSKTRNPPNDTSFNAWTWNASYKHRFSPALLAYANYGRSFRPGGFDSTGANGATIPQSFYNYGSEKSDSFEVGIKGELLGGRMIYTFAAYYQKFNNYISRIDNVACTGNPNAAAGPVPGTVFATSDGLAPNGANVCNANGGNLTFNGDASARGIEFELRGEVLPNWTAQFSTSYANAHFDNAMIPCNDYDGDGTPDNEGIPAVQKGRYVSLCKSRQQLAALPKFQASLTSEYAFDVSDGAQVYMRGLARYGSSFTDAASLIDVPSTFKVDAFIGARLQSGFDFTLFARNLLNEQNTTYGNEIFGLFGNATGYRSVNYDQRREFGAQVRLDF